MVDPTITCPHCRQEIKLTESLAAPLVESTRIEFERQLATKNAEVAKSLAEVREREAQLKQSQATIEDQIAERLKGERALISAEEAKKAKLALTEDLDQAKKQLSDLQEVLTQNNEKLAEAQQAQAENIRKQRELDDAKRELDLTVEKRIQEGLGATRAQAKSEAEESMKLKVTEKEQTILSMQKQIEELRRKAEQGSQQLQGEVQELDLEGTLRNRFPTDSIEPVAKGQFGADVIQVVNGAIGVPLGKIIWESKRTSTWGGGWIAKLKADQRAVKADCALMVTQALPKGITTFGFDDGVWVSSPPYALSLVVALRQAIIDVANVRQSVEGHQTKQSLMYRYVTSQEFRQRVEAIGEAFNSMREDLLKEKRAIQSQWAKREKQIDRIMDSTVGIWGDVIGIAGKNVDQIDGFELDSLIDEESVVELLEAGALPSESPAED